jgi:hypothetical protein
MYMKPINHVPLPTSPPFILLPLTSTPPPLYLFIIFSTSEDGIVGY